MRILLDECVPKRLKRDLPGHEARAVPEMGWAGKQNGDLLELAQGTFDALLTVDRNLSVQHDVSKFSIAVVVMAAKNNRLSDLRPLVPGVLAILETVIPGTVTRVGG